MKKRFFSLFLSNLILAESTNNQNSREARVREFDSTVIDFPVDPDTALNPENNGQIIFVTGELQIEGPARDPDFGFVAHGQPLLHRNV